MSIRWSLRGALFPTSISLAGVVGAVQTAWIAALQASLGTSIASTIYDHCKAVWEELNWFVPDSRRVELLPAREFLGRCISSRQRALDERHSPNATPPVFRYIMAAGRCRARKPMLF